MLDWINTIDTMVIEFIQNYLNIKSVDIIMKVFTYLGEVGAVWIVICIIFLFFKPYRKAGLLGGCSILFTFLLVTLLLKNLIQRPRPFQTLEHLTLVISQPPEYSFPSGHAASSFTAATAIAVNSKNRLLSILVFILATLISLSRLYLKVHYLSDIVVGALFGTMLALLITFIHNKLIPKNVRRSYEIQT